LFFIGETNENKLTEIDYCLSDLEIGMSLNEIEFNLSRINAFPKLRFPRVLIIELLNKDKKVELLSQKINEAMNRIGFRNDKHFQPHITLGRVKREHKINLNGLENNIKSDLHFSVNEFQLMESKLKSSGSEYSVLKRYLFNS
jgi:2'-5' RNA ligase